MPFPGKNYFRDFLAYHILISKVLNLQIRKNIGHDLSSLISTIPGCRATDAPLSMHELCEPPLKSALEEIDFAHEF